MVNFEIGERVEWLSRPTSDGYLQGTVQQIGEHKVKKGTVQQIGEHKVKIRIQSPKTGEYKEKWVEARYLRKVEVA